MRTRLGLFAACTLIIAVGLPRTAAAQFASALEGTVTDTSNSIVPGATVTLVNEETGITQSVVTTATGYYRFPALGGGLYTAPRLAHRIQDRRAGARQTAGGRNQDDQPRRWKSARRRSKSPSTPGRRSSRRRRAACRA